MIPMVMKVNMVVARILMRMDMNIHHLFNPADSDNSEDSDHL